MAQSNQPRWFMAVAVIALIWNLLGVMAFVMQMMITPEAIAQLPAAEQALYEGTQWWGTGAFGVAVLGGTLGCVLLVIKKALATPVFVASLIGILVQVYHNIFIIDSISVYGLGGLIMPIMILLGAIALVWLSTHARKSSWLD